MTLACQAPVRMVRAATAAAVTSPFVLATVPEDRIRMVLHVDAANPNASDANAGGEERPFLTVQKAVKVAQQSKRQGVGVKVLVHPGVYREQILMPVEGQENDAPLVIEGTEKGAVILSGSDIWSGWQPQGTTNIYTHRWPYNWGLAPYPSGWEGSVILQPIVRRREMVFVNGVPLVQVLSPADLNGNSFFVSELDQTISMRLAPDTRVEDALVEVATRSPIFSAQGKTNIVLRNLTFRHGNPAVQDSAVRISDSSGVLVEDCDFSWNNWDGLDVVVSNDVTIRTSVANHNGGSGLGGYKIKRLVMEDNDSSYDNWRGAQGQFFGWAVAGGKFGAIHDGLIRRQRATANQSRGFWLDFDNVNVALESCALYGNKTDGIFIEANQGPVAIRNSVMALNLEGAGVSGANSSDITVTGSVLWGNGRSQIQITGVDSRAVSNWETGASMNVRSERWSLAGNLMWVDNTSQLWVETPDWPVFLTSLTSRANLWSRPVDPRAFRIGPRQIGLYDWQQATSADRDSIAYIR